MCGIDLVRKRYKTFLCTSVKESAQKYFQFIPGMAEQCAVAQALLKDFVVIVGAILALSAGKRFLTKGEKSTVLCSVASGMSVATSVSVGGVPYQS